jgi:hypothetical protein
MNRLKWIVLLWWMPWAAAFGLYVWGYHPEMGELVPHAYIPEFRKNLGNLDRRNWLLDVEELNPFDSIHVDAEKGLLLIGDSFGVMMSMVFRIWFPEDRKWEYLFDSNHRHNHWSPRKVLWDKLQDPEVDLSKISEVFLVELEHQGGVSSMQDFRTKQAPQPTRWQLIPSPAAGSFGAFINYYFFPERMWPALREIQTGIPVAEDIPMHLSNGTPIDRLSLMTTIDPAWLGVQDTWIQHAVKDYQMLDSLCTERGLNFTVVHIPDRSTLYAEWIVGADTTMMRAHYRAFEHAVDSAGIRQIHALNRFDAAHKAGETNLFLLHDNHWNSRGISVIARDILQNLSTAEQAEVTSP